jgi:class 3 adenylate cyclase
MSLRLKMLALASLLLLVFAVTTALSASLIARVMDEMAGTVEYHIPVTAAISEIDVLTFEYELNLRRLLDSGARDSDRLRETLARQKVLSDRLRTVIAQVRPLIAKAIDDERNDVSDRLQFARVDGVLEQLGARMGPFLALGASVQAAIEQGRAGEAIAIADGFSAYESEFGADLARVRETITRLTRDSMDETRGQSASIRWINVGLFVAASTIGLALVALIGYRLQRAFQRLLDGTRRVEQGELSVQLPVTSRDEIGQLTGSFNRMILELQSKARITDTFGKFVDPRIVATLLGDEAADTHAAARRASTVFFSDIKSFTALSERLTADVIVRLLNAYFTAVTRVIRERNGIVDKYIGDAVMAFWTPPFAPGESHAEEACLAALAQQATLAEFRRELSNVTGLRRDVPDFNVRMGLATGEVVVGTIGSDTTKSFTVIGDTVNVASRLEGVNRVYGTSILVSGETMRLAQRSVEARELDLLLVEGKSEPIRVFELMGAAGELAPEQDELRGVFGEGLAAYRERRWDDAARKFAESLRILPGDGPSGTFLHRVEVLRATPPAADWNGVWATTK